MNRARLALHQAAISPPYFLHRVVACVRTTICPNPIYGFLMGLMLGNDVYCNNIRESLVLVHSHPLGIPSRPRSPRRLMAFQGNVGEAVVLDPAG